MDSVSKLSGDGQRSRSRSIRSRSRSRARLREIIKFIHDSNEIEKQFEKKFQNSGDHAEIDFKLNESLDKNSENFAPKMTQQVKRFPRDRETRKKLKKISKIEKEFDKNKIQDQQDDGNQSESESKESGKFEKILRPLLITFDGSKKVILRLVQIVRNWILTNREKNKSQDRTFNWTKLDFKLKNVQRRRRRNHERNSAQFIPQEKKRISEPFKRQSRPLNFKLID